MCRQEHVIMQLAKDFFGDILLADFRRRHAENLITWRRDHVLASYGNIMNKVQLSPATLNRNISVLSCFFNWCIKRDYYDRHNPFSLAKLPERNFREVTVSR